MLVTQLLSYPESGYLNKEICAHPEIYWTVLSQLKPLSNQYT